MQSKSRYEATYRAVLRERAERCRRLADAIGDLAFAIKLHALSAEYESRAKGTEASVRIGWRYYDDHPERITLARQETHPDSHSNAS